MFVLFLTKSLIILLLISYCFSIFFWCRTFVGELALSIREDLKHANDMIQLQTHLLRMGYATVIRSDNRMCAHCTELTLIRIKCPATVISVAV